MAAEYLYLKQVIHKPIALFLEMKENFRKASTLRGNSLIFKSRMTNSSEGNSGYSMSITCDSTPTRQ